MALTTTEEIELLTLLEAESAAPAPIGLAEFIETTTTFTLEPWQRLLCDRLERLRDERGARLLIHGPPQFGKSIIISQRFPAWLIGHRPTIRVPIACYNETHAARFTASNLAIAQSAEFRRLFPAVRIPTVAAERDWSTLEREELADGQPTMRALGLNSGFTGLGADTLIIDDPYKNKQDAFSGVIAGRVWDFWTETASPRLNPESNVVVMFHRWKEDDLAGRLIQQGGWEVLRFPAICDGGDDDPTYTTGLRTIGEPLSERFPVAYLERVKSGSTEDEHGVGDATFESLWQGNPKPRGGLMFRAEWFSEDVRVDATPAESAHGTIRRVRYYDLAASEAGEACETAGVLVAKVPVGGKQFLYFVEDVHHGRWNPTERNQQIRHQAAMDAARYGAGTVQLRYETPIGMETRDARRRLVTALAGVANPREHDAKGSKEFRAESVQVHLQVGNVRFVRGAWLTGYVDQMIGFPQMKLKDMVDGTSGAFEVLSRPTLEEKMQG